MCPKLRDFATKEDANNVSILDSTETMSNGNCNSVAGFGRRIQGVLNNLLALRVQRASSYVKQQDLAA